MILYPRIDPVIFSAGPLQVRWYGAMYLIAFGLAWWFATRRATREDVQWTREQISDIIFYGALGVILGGRIGYILFYNFEQFLNTPSMIIKVWNGGMSFHGGLIGVTLAMWLFARRYKKSFFEVSDFVAPLIPLGLGVGRVGNFINNELWGRVTDVPWAFMIKPGGQGVHPSQLYEAFLEGLVLFLILWIYSSRPRPLRSVSGMFLLFYGLFRFMVEFVRQPDQQLGFIAFGWVSMGQILSLPMVLLGMYLIASAGNNKKARVGQ